MASGRSNLLDAGDQTAKDKQPAAPYCPEVTWLYRPQSVPDEPPVRHSNIRGGRYYH